jgi:hypothetical protein
MDNVQNCDSYINIPSSETHGSYSYFPHYVVYTEILSLFQKCLYIIVVIDIKEGLLFFFYCYRRHYRCHHNHSHNDLFRFIFVFPRISYVF